MKAVLVNYNFTPTWLFDYPELDYLIADRSDSDEYLKDFPQERVIKTENKGNVDYDKLSFLVEQYDHLPDVFLWGKTNIFKYIERDEFDKALKKPVFTPLLSQNHKTYWDKYGPVCYYDQGMYYERNDSWFLREHHARHFSTFSEWCGAFNIPQLTYVPFPPGGNFILTKERVHRYSRDFYNNMRELMPYTETPGEAQCAERSYYLLWQ